MASAVGYLVHVGVGVQPLNFSLGLAAIEVLVGAPEVAPANKRCILLMHYSIN